MTNLLAKSRMSADDYGITLFDEFDGREYYRTTTGREFELRYHARYCDGSVLTDLSDPTDPILEGVQYEVAEAWLYDPEREWNHEPEVQS